MSGIYIPGMEMPKTCHCCRMCVQVSDGDIDWHWECCLLCEKVSRFATDIIPGCPLAPVPDHGRLIDAAELQKDIHEHDYILSDKWNSTDSGMFTHGIDYAISVAPTIIPADKEGEG